MEFGWSILTAEKVKNQELIFIKAFEELIKPQNKKDCQIFSGMGSSLSKWNPTVELENPSIRKSKASKWKFVWTDKMDQEYGIVRKTMLEQIQLTPFDSNKSLRLVIDGAST